MYAICLLFLHFATKQNVSNRSQVLLISRSSIYAGIFQKKIRKNNLLSAVTRRRLRRFMYISENIYRLDIFILCVFFRSRIKISVNNKLYMKQICHMSPRETARESWRLLKTIPFDASLSVFRQNKNVIIWITLLSDKCSVRLYHRSTSDRPLVIKAICWNPFG